METIIVQFSIIEISIITVCLSVLQFLLANWIKSRLENSIRHEYDKKLEEYKFLQMQRQKSEVIGRFFAEWIKFRGKEIDFLDKNQLLDYYARLNQMSFEISLWISDDKILGEVMKLFQNNPEAKNIRELTGQFRKLILDIENDNFDVQEITIWPTHEIAKKIGLIDENK